CFFFLIDWVENVMYWLENQIDSLESQMNGLESRVDGLGNQMDGLESRMTNRMQRIEVDLLGNKVIPRLNTIESCYTDTYNRYRDYADRMEAAFADTDLLKKVVSEHSETIRRLA
ncbi:MAG: hypothetical protein K2M91_14255, partial [Lachnospiraceae bacterium]|nr:hypothetical protein [Lachnospiraceae bacterium]